MPDWQSIAVLVCVIVAGHFLVRRLLNAARGESKGCGTCPSNKSAPQVKPLVPLEAPDERRHASK